MRVKNPKAFAMFDYKSDFSSKLDLGEVVSNQQNEIGVVIQIHDETNFRTDMFGNCDFSEITIATIEEIRQFRPEIEKDLRN